MRNRTLVIFLIVIAQFFCVSLWFASNAVIDGLSEHYQLPNGYETYLTILVQIGFIAGTLVFSLFALADRIKPSLLFFFSALLASLFNYSIVFDHNTVYSLFLLRFLTGFFLAGIYPVGMKIAADYFEKGLGKTLGLVVGALVIGTALPHLIKFMSIGVDWENVFKITSLLAIIGGGMILLVKDGPYRKKASRVRLSSSFQLFKNGLFKKASFGYFGHMWELYAFWVFVPTILYQYKTYHVIESLNGSFWSFMIIGLGALGCILGSRIAYAKGNGLIAYASLASSTLCCLLFPIMFFTPQTLFLSFMILWGIVVITDSPLFSSLIANSVEGEFKGTALTLSTCIGFAITIISIQLLGFLNQKFDSPIVFLLLSIGPIGSLLYNKLIKQNHET